LHKIEQRKKRGFESFRTVSDVVDTLKSQFANRKLYVKYAVDKTVVDINEYLDDNTVMVVTDPGYEHDGTLIIYGLSDKYLEVDLEVLEERGPGYYRCKIKSARRATSGRRDLRFRISDEQAYASNFRISKHRIDVTGFKIPTSIKVLLDQFQTNNSGIADIVKVDVFNMENRNNLLNLIRRTSKSLFISDTSNPESYRAITDDFIDLAELYGDQLGGYIKKNIERGYRSIIIVPIIYINAAENSVPFGYIQVISKSETFGIDKVLELKDYTFKLVDRIRDANTELLQVHQEIVDISRGGAKLKITDTNLKDYIKHAKGFIFDLVFKLQAPITIYGEIKVTYAGEDDSVYVGVDFEGNSSRKDEMKRFYSILKPMEADYKARLIKSIRQKQQRQAK
jgi:hypothetical protein